MAEVREVEFSGGELPVNWTDAINYATVDNSIYAYYVWAGPAGDRLWLTGVQIEYRFSEPY